MRGRVAVRVWTILDPLWCATQKWKPHRLSPLRSAVPDEKLWRSCLRFPSDQTGTRHGAVAHKQSLHVAHNFGDVCGKKMICWWQPGHDSVACDLGHRIRLFHCVWVENAPAVIHHAPSMMLLWMENFKTLFRQGRSQFDVRWLVLWWGWFNMYVKKVTFGTCAGCKFALRNASDYDQEIPLTNRYVHFAKS